MAELAKLALLTRLATGPLPVAACNARVLKELIDDDAIDVAEDHFTRRKVKVAQINERGLAVLERLLD